jgi:hypothetical protein
MCRAWVNFNGTGTVALRASGNVSSITDNGVGDYTVIFTTGMPDADYAISLSLSNTTTGDTQSPKISTGSVPLFDRIRIGCGFNGIAFDPTYVTAAIFR